MSHMTLSKTVELSQTILTPFEQNILVSCLGGILKYKTFNQLSMLQSTTQHQVTKSVFHCKHCSFAVEGSTVEPFCMEIYLLGDLLQLS